MAFDRHDLLRRAGFAVGDVVFQSEVGVSSETNNTTTSTTYVDNPSHHDHLLVWDRAIPDPVQGVYQTVMFVLVGTDETVDVRLRNTTDNETIHETTGISADGFVEMGPTDYTPPTSSSPISIKAQLRTNPGNNSSSITTIATRAGARL